MLDGHISWDSRSAQVLLHTFKCIFAVLQYSIVRRPGWGIAVCGSCSVVGLRWWAGVCCVCLWWFPALVSACLCIPNHCVFVTHSIQFVETWQLLAM